ncbi:hypothetical protein MHA01_03440 [Marinococcus halophilus]|uniref:Uncharacterized protein n=1 Tax=Marinococcus halophilus TaxID=1371 RepID=A0A510Y2C0_MARHA|nr:hypothetical protein MHA01_03440 [Marinococcus halophilus]
MIPYAHRTSLTRKQCGFRVKLVRTKGFPASREYRRNGTFIPGNADVYVKKRIGGPEIWNKKRKPTQLNGRGRR